MANFDLPRRVRVSDDVIFQEISGEYVLLNIANEQYFGLDAVGTRIWSLLAETGEPDKVVAQLKHEYEVDEETLRNDLIVLLNELKTEGLIIVE